MIVGCLLWFRLSRLASGSIRLCLGAGPPGAEREAGPAPARAARRLDPIEGHSATRAVTALSSLRRCWTRWIGVHRGAGSGELGSKARQLGALLGSLGLPVLKLLPGRGQLTRDVVNLADDTAHLFFGGLSPVTLVLGLS
jgi:hypothetical protein